MTFYNIIFGILFIGALRQVLLLSDTLSIWTAATVAVLVFNDAITTSQVLEANDKPPYTMPMKLIDLLDFMLLSLSLIALSPFNNPFQIAPSKHLVHFLLRPWAIWLILGVYWIFAVIWNALAQLYVSDRWSRIVKVSSVSLFFPFFVMIGITSVVRDVNFLGIAKFIVFAWVTAHFLIFKPLGQRR